MNPNTMSRQELLKVAIDNSLVADADKGDWKVGPLRVLITEFYAKDKAQKELKKTELKKYNATGMTAQYSKNHVSGRFHIDLVQSAIIHAPQSMTEAHIKEEAEAHGFKITTLTESS